MQLVPESIQGLCYANPNLRWIEDTKGKYIEIRVGVHIRYKTL